MLISGTACGAFVPILAPECERHHTLMGGLNVLWKYQQSADLCTHTHTASAVLSPRWVGQPWLCLVTMTMAISAGRSTGNP